MRHGWKTRIDERRYFEEKKQEREDKQVFMTMVRRKMAQDFEEQLNEMRGNHEIN